jgi:hypothetical protein
MKIGPVSTSLILAVCLSGCGGGSDDPGPHVLTPNALAPVAVRDGLNTAAGLRTTVRGGPGDVMAVTYTSPGLTSITLIAVDDTAPAVPGFKGYRSVFGDLVIVRGDAETWAAHAGIFANDGFERLHERIGDTVLPTSGSATFTGSYMGLISDISDHSYRGYITGDTEMFADFDAVTMQGQITNRINTSNRAFDTLIFPARPIDPSDGRFGGETQGGILIGLPDFDGARGVYSGLVVGPAGQTAVGSVVLVHERSGVATLRETGVFAAD